jgi:hypothetical protein
MDAAFESISYSCRGIFVTGEKKKKESTLTSVRYIGSITFTNRGPE